MDKVGFDRHDSDALLQIAGGVLKGITAIDYDSLDDLRQVIVLALVEAANQIEASSRPRQYAFRVGRNAAIDWLKAENQRRAGESNLPATLPGDIDVLTDKQIAAQYARNARVE